MSPHIQEAIDRVLDRRFPSGWRSYARFTQSLSKEFMKHTFGDVRQ
jgi:hypothetical protein